MTSASGPLSDLRVVDISTVLAGPGCARHLADFGADVIKVERPGSGDTVRAMGWRDPSDDVTLFWKVAGRGKRTIVLDLNFAYNPSCAYDPAWACPLAQPGNVLAAEVPVGERYSVA